MEAITRLVRLVVGGVVLSLTAAAASDGPRYTVLPGPTGVTRVDTQTGAVSHCNQRDGAWQCEPSAVVAPDLDRVSEAIAALNARVDGLSVRLDQIGAPPAQSTPTRTFTAQVVGRFLEMVRRLKHATAGPVRPDAP